MPSARVPQITTVITPVLGAGRPVFVGKPVAACLTDVIRIYRLAERHKVPIFSSSSRRLHARILETADPNRVGTVSPVSAEETLEL